MGLRAKVANKPIIDDLGFVYGVISEVLDIPERLERQGKKEVKFSSQFQFIILSEGTQKTITFNIWVGQNINPDKFKNDDKLEYNRLTTLLLSIGFIDEKDLTNLENNPNLLKDLESLEGQKIKFKLESSKNNPSLKQPKIDSIKLITDSK